jgi:hypothetical protein
LTWSLRQRSNAQKGTSEIWQAVAPAVVSNMVVKANRSNGSYVGSIVLTAFAGADTSVNGAIIAAAGRSGAPTATLTPTEGRIVGLGGRQRLGPGRRAHCRRESDQGRRVPAKRGRHVLGAAPNRAEHRRDHRPGHDQRHGADE